MYISINNQQVELSKASAILGIPEQELINAGHAFTENQQNNINYQSDNYESLS